MKYKSTNKTMTPVSSFWMPCLYSVELLLAPLWDFCPHRPIHLPPAGGSIFSFERGGGQVGGHIWSSSPAGNCVGACSSQGTFLFASTEAQVRAKKRISLCKTTYPKYPIFPCSIPIHIPLLSDWWEVGPEACGDESVLINASHFTPN